MRMTKDSTRKMTHAALLVALVLLLSFTNLGYIPFLTLSITIVHIPAILAVLTSGTGVGFLVAFLFGASSWYLSLTNPTSVLSPLFQNPLVSILPRLLIVPAMLLALRLLRRKAHSKLAYGVAAATGSLANTVCTLSAVSLYIHFCPQVIGMDAASGRVMIGTIWATSMINAALECVAAVLICVAVMTAFDKVYKRV
ncbi:MAG: ECF transporter S component [Clostridia bacterium]|nr:ECF transporter S component [Clostridia bacterium]